MKTPRGQRLLDVQAVCDASAERAAKAHEVFGCRAFTDLDKMLGNADIEAVCLFSGPVGRAGLIRKIIRAGKHVMTTKPFELDATAALDVLREAKQLGMVVHQNSPPATTPADILHILAWQKQYNLGRPLAAHWQTWCNYREKPDGTWYDSPKLCPVAPIFRLGIYAINDILYFFRDPREVFVMQSRLFTSRPTPDHAQLSIKFADGSLASIFASFCVDSAVPYPDRLTLNFERGTVYRNITAQGSRNNLELQVVTPGPDGKPYFDQATGFDPEQCGGHSSYQWEAFIQAIRGEKLVNELDPKQIVDGIHIINAMARSEETGQAQSVE